ncbi:hypothetical protein H9V85_003652 [Salmonella enterica subsp. enterica serovar Louisiana]|nr:hypothetical protein [Salmonella enterica subsp. enterica]EGC8525998.1 hypothetical protein [Salmonella enterica subsp. enterica serovar Louisiana]EHF9643855.1 hypothetical protein [Salmonella enterica]EHV9882933.1 hypothetical protein [Salmonella enterica subsp. enterica serovar Durham]EHW1156260.1 hypothetical protein [Salmonella enterica subsp. enterica serovar Takoradi]EIP0098481.1 hypothetical protein [Salmonella enterica subsp. enterica serovar Wangata]
MAGDKMKDLFEAIIENVIKVHNLKPYKELENDVKRDVIHRSIFIYKLELCVYDKYIQHPANDCGNILTGISLVKYLIGKANPPSFYSDALTYGDVIRIMYDSVVRRKAEIDMNYVAELQGYEAKSRLPFYPEKEWIPGLAVEMLS